MSQQQLVAPVPTVEPPPGKENGWVYLADLPTPPRALNLVVSPECR